jgi:lysozyme
LNTVVTASWTTIDNVNYFPPGELFVSDDFLETFKSAEFEWVSLTAYPDGTIGGEPNFSIWYGHSWAKEGEVITQAEADALLKEDVEKYSDYISEYITIPLTQNMYDALFSFCYNAWPWRLRDVAEYLNARDVSWAMAYMKSIIYWRPDGWSKEVSDWLVARREKEVTLFMQNDDRDTNWDLA